MTEEPTCHRWRVHLVRQSPERLPVILLALGGVPTLGWMVMGHWLFAIVAFWMLLSATADYLLPIRYELDAEGIRQRGWSPRVMRWDRVKRLVWGEQGVLLSPFAKPSRLDAYRGVFVWFGDQREQVESLILRYCKSATNEHKPKKRARKAKQSAEGAR